MSQRDITGTTNMRKRILMLTAATIIINAGCMAQTKETDVFVQNERNSYCQRNVINDASMPCTVYSDYAFPTYDAPQEWIWNPNDTLTIIWQSTAPFQRFSYRMSYDDSWHTRECRGTFSIPASELKNAKEVEWRIVVGCNKINNDAVYGTVEVIHSL